MLDMNKSKNIRPQSPNQGQLLSCVTDQVIHGDVRISPAFAKLVLEKCFYPPQSARMLRASPFIQARLECLRRGYWQDYSQITFARLPDGAFILVDGYHRLSAVSLWNGSPLFNVVVVDCADMAAVDSLYASFDRVGLNRPRTTGQALSAVDLAGQLGVQKWTAEALYDAIMIIANDMRIPTRTDEERLIEMRIFDVRAAAVLQYANEARLIDAALSGARQTIKKRMLSASVTAVMAQTFRYCPERSTEFWSACANNDGLRKGTPEHTLVEVLLNRTFGGRNNSLMTAAALAWNAFYERRPLVMLKPAAAIFRILGTPYAKGVQQ